MNRSGIGCNHGYVVGPFKSWYYGMDYGVMFVRAWVVLFVVGCCSCSQPGTGQSKGQLRRYALHGEILRLDPQGKIATIKHEKIGDWMGAMTMEFPVKDPQEFSTLREGEHINGTVFVEDLSYWVAEIKEDSAAK